MSENAERRSGTPSPEPGATRAVLVEASTSEHYQAARVLFQAYATGLGADLEFQGFAGEVDGLPGRYAPPGGTVFLARLGERFVGCVALRPLGESVCEMKRLYVVPDARGCRLGELLAREIVRKAASLGYRRMRLDTLKTMRAARCLYLSLGFRRIAPYYHNPLPDPEFYELELSGRDPA